MNRVAVEPRLLHWACERSGRDRSILQRRFPRLVAWEQGAVQPTFKQLEQFAKATYTPIGYLFLPQPPVEQFPVTDFRTVAGASIGRPSLDLLDTVHLCQQRQDWYRDEARTAGAAPLPFVGSLDTSVDPAMAATRLREALAFGVEQRRRAETWSGALRQFIEHADATGILVMVSGVVGSNTRRPLDPEEFRGFALVDPLAPLVFVNGADTKAAQMFTLAHEIAHLWLGESGVSNADVATAPDHGIERSCNRVAAEFLVPLELIRDEFNSRAELNIETSRLARRLKVSTLVVLRRIYDAGALNREQFWATYRQEMSRLRLLASGTGGNAVRNVGARVSKRLARALVVSALEGRTSYTECFRLLGVKKHSTFESVAASLGLGV